MTKKKLARPESYTIQVVTDYKTCCDELGMFDMSQWFGLDIETARADEYLEDGMAGLDPYRSKIRLIQIAIPSEQKILVFDLFKFQGDVGVIKKFLSVGNFFAHNALFEYKHLLHWGVKSMKCYCTMMMYRMYLRTKFSEPGSFKATLSMVVNQLYGVSVPKQLQRSNWNEIELTEDQYKYAAYDSVYCSLIGEGLHSMLKTTIGKGYTLNMQAIQPVARMMLAGIYLDKEALQKEIAVWTEHQEEAKRHCNKIFTIKRGKPRKTIRQRDRLKDPVYPIEPINLNSAPQLSHWITDNVPREIRDNWPRNDKSSNYKTDHDTLKRFSEDVEGIKYLLEYKKYQKRLSTYGTTLINTVNPVTNRLHCDYTLCYTTTGRLSSRSPNLQNLPRGSEMRGTFVASKSTNSLVCADYSQIELRVAAIVSGDSVMLEAYKQGKDLHKLTAANISGKPFDKVTKEERQMAKAVNFGLLFGMGAPKLRLYAKTSYGVDMSKDQAEEAVEVFRDTYPEYRKWQISVAEDAEYELVSKTPCGIIRRLSDTNYYSCSMNTPVQGGAAEVVIRAIYRVDKAYRNKKLPARLINTVHDELLVECKTDCVEEAKDILCEEMSKAFTDIFPAGPTRDLVEASSGHSWEDAK